MSLCQIPSWGSASTLLILRLLALLAMMSQACAAKVRWVSQVTPRILGVRFRGITWTPILTFGCMWDWWVSGVNKFTDDLWGAMESSFLPAYSTSLVISRLAFTTASSTQGEEAQYGARYPRTGNHFVFP